VAIERNSSSYCDGYYYKNMMNEKSIEDDKVIHLGSINVKNYPVTVWAFNV
jgi:hypothetical protein